MTKQHSYVGSEYAKGAVGFYLRSQVISDEHMRAVIEEGEKRHQQNIQMIESLNLDPKAKVVALRNIEKSHSEGLKAFKKARPLIFKKFQDARSR